MANIAVLKVITYTPTFIEEQLEAALAAVGIDLPQPKTLSLDCLTEEINEENYTFDLWRELTLPNCKSIRYLKTLQMPSIIYRSDVRNHNKEKAKAGVCLDMLQRVLDTDSCLGSETVFFQARDRELELYCTLRSDGTHSIYINGNFNLLVDAINKYNTHLGKTTNLDEFIGKYKAHDIEEEGLRLTKLETSKAMNVIAYYLSLSGEYDSL